MTNLEKDLKQKEIDYSRLQDNIRSLKNQVDTIENKRPVQAVRPIYDAPVYSSIENNARYDRIQTELS